MNSQEDLPRPRFTGIFIPSELLAIEELSMLELMLLSWVDALHNDSRGGCFAKNEYLAKKLRVKENTVAKALVHLRDLHLIEQVSFDGRNRVIKTKVDEYKIFATKWSQSNAGLDLNPMQDWIKIQGRVGEKSKAVEYDSLGNSESHTYHERKEESKEENNNTHPTLKKPDAKQSAAVAARVGVNSSSSSPKVNKLPKIAFGSHVRLTQEEHDGLCKAFGASMVTAIIDEMNDYCAASRPKGYADYAAAIRQWVRKRQETTTTSAYKRPPTVDRRTRNMDGTPVDAPHLEGLF